MLATIDRPANGAADPSIRQGAGSAGFLYRFYGKWPASFGTWRGQPWTERRCPPRDPPPSPPVDRWSRAADIVEKARIRHKKERSPARSFQTVSRQYLKSRHGLNDGEARRSRRGISVEPLDFRFPIIIWNSPCFRFIIPDAIAVSLAYLQGMPIQHHRIRLTGLLPFETP